MRSWDVESISQDWTSPSHVPYITQTPALWQVLTGLGVKCWLCQWQRCVAYLLSCRGGSWENKWTQQVFAVCEGRLSVVVQGSRRKAGSWVRRERGTLEGPEQARNGGYLGAAPLTRLGSREKKHQSGSSVSSDAYKTRERQVLQKSRRRLIWGFSW